MAFKLSAGLDLTEEGLNELAGPSFSDTLLQSVSAPVLGALDLLDIPGSYLRGVLSGRGFTRTTGREFLDRVGLTRSQSDSGFDWMALLADTVVDPLMFTGSVTGLTKAGKQAARTQKLLDQLDTFKKVKSFTTDTKLADKLTKRIDDITTTVKDTFGKLPSELGEADKLAPTRLAQVQAGQRGISLTIPFTNVELAKAKWPNEILEKMVSKLPLAAIGESAMVKSIKSKFSTKLSTSFGQTLNDLEDNILSEQQLATDLDTQGLIKQFDIEVDKIVSPTTKTTERTGVKTKLGEDIIATQESLGAPERVRQLEKQIDERTNITIQNIVSRRDSRIAHAKGSITDPQKLNDTIEGFNKLANSQIEAARTRAVTRQGKLANYKNKFAEILDIQAPNGTYARSVATQFDKANVNSLDLAKAQGIAIEGLDDFINYVPHVLSRDGQRLFRSDDKFKAFVGKAVVKGIPDFAKKRKFKGQTLSEINKTIKKDFGIDNAFVMDPFQIYRQHEIATQMAVSKARNYQTAIYFELGERPTYADIRGKLSEADKAAGGTGMVHRAEIVAHMDKFHSDMVPLSEVLKTSGMNKLLLKNDKGEDKIVQWSLGAAAKKDGDTIKKALVDAGFGRAAIPRAIYDDLLKIYQTHTSEQRPFWAAWDAVNQTMRTYLTSFHPSHIGTNALGNTFMNYISLGMIDTIKYQTKAMAVLAKKKSEAFPQLFTAPLDKLNKSEQRLVEFARLGSAGSTFREITVEEGKRIFFNDKNIDKIVQGVLDNPATRFGWEANDFFEQSSKLAHYMAMRDRGFSQGEALTSVKKYLFDYSDLTEFEQKYMRKAVLFYTFARKNMPLAIAETFQNRRALVLGKASQESLASEEFIPEYVKETGSIAVGGDTFVDMKNPIFEANRFGSQGEGPSRVFDRLIGSLVPQVKTSYELLTGRDTFRSKPLSELDRVSPAFEGFPGTETFVDKSGQKVTVGNPNVLQILRNLPTSRIQQSIEDITSPDIVFSGSILGPRVRELPEQLRKTKRIDEVLSRKLRKEGTVRTFDKFFPVAEQPSESVTNMLKALNDNQKEFKRLLGGKK